MKTYIERKSIWLENTLESWKKEHRKAIQVFDLEDFYSDVIKYVDDLFNKEDLLWRDAIKTKEEKKLTQWDKVRKKCLGVASIALSYIEKCASHLKASQYKGSKINISKLKMYKKMVSDALHTDNCECYLDRSDVKQALEESGKEIEKGDYTYDD